MANCLQYSRSHYVEEGLLRLRSS